MYFSERVIEREQVERESKDEKESRDGKID